VDSNQQRSNSSNIWLCTASRANLCCKSTCHCGNARDPHNSPLGKDFCHTLSWPCSRRNHCDTSHTRVPHCVSPKRTHLAFDVACALLPTASSVTFSITVRDLFALCFAIFMAHVWARDWMFALPFTTRFFFTTLRLAPLLCQSLTHELRAALRPLWCWGMFLTRCPGLVHKVTRVTLCAHMRPILGTLCPGPWATIRTHALLHFLTRARSAAPVLTCVFRRFCKSDLRFGKSGNFILWRSRGSRQRQAGGRPAIRLAI
jgi:hypothetical protein